MATEYYWVRTAAITGSSKRKADNCPQQLPEAGEALAQKALELQELLTKTMDVQKRERQRIAQDLYDGTSRLLTGAMLELKSARQRLNTGEAIWIRLKVRSTTKNGLCGPPVWT